VFSLFTLLLILLHNYTGKAYPDFRNILLIFSFEKNITVISLVSDDKAKTEKSGHPLVHLSCKNKEEL
jgi:hypothetical protein